MPNNSTNTKKKQPRIKTKFSGVYYRESDTKRHRGKPDRSFLVWYSEGGKGRWKTIGWASEGVTAQYANAKRTEIIAALKNPADNGNSEFTLNAAAELWYGRRELDGKSTKKERQRYDKHLRRYFGVLPLNSITTDMLLRTRNKLQQTLSAESVRKCFAFARSCVNLAITEKRFPGPNPFSTNNSQFSLPTPDNGALRFFTPEEAKKLLDALKLKQSRLAYDLSFVSLKTGLRSTELFQLLGNSIEWTGHLRFVSKTKEIHRVNAPRDVLELLSSYKRQPNEHIFQARDGGPIVNGVTGVFDRTVTDLGFNDVVTDSKLKVTFHTWRHTFASWLAQSGKVTLHELMVLMRHKNLQMTLRYAHLIPDENRKKLSIIDEMML
ncbi:tyrosine-type recombinase/integrase [Maridesulfovibrio sp.]|uniref:tyrosine-type recombinase/integrase n=1 Tax=Maridesulfovibrio sp. TaxID=2795000 RepID=UPI0029C9F9E5|nr:tyrosine-type recombinase/integrase [Maridesulfovibrio sp.]